MVGIAKAQIFAYVVGAIVTGIYLLGQMNRTALRDVAGTVAVTLSLSAFLMAALTVSKTWGGFRDRQSQVWLCGALGLSAFFASETVAYAYLLSGTRVPSISIVDIFSISAYVLILAGLLIQLWPFREAVSKKAALVVALVGFLLMLVLWSTIMGSKGASSFLDLAIYSLYPILDIVLLAVSIPALLLFGSGVFWKPYSHLVAGVILGLAGDMLSTWVLLLRGQTSYVGDPLELFFDWAYIVVALGFYLRLRQVRAGAL